MIFHYINKVLVPAPLYVIKHGCCMLYRHPSPENLFHRVALFQMKPGAGHIVPAFYTNKPDTGGQMAAAGYTYIRVNQPQDVPVQGKKKFHCILLSGQYTKFPGKLLTFSLSFRYISQESKIKLKERALEYSTPPII